MRTVIVFQSDDSGNPVEIGRAVLNKNGEAQLEGFTRHRGLREQLEHGLYVWPQSQPRIQLKDGAQFLNGLPKELHGSRIWAEEVE